MRRKAVVQYWKMFGSGVWVCDARVDDATEELLASRAAGRKEKEALEAAETMATKLRADGFTVTIRKC